MVSRFRERDVGTRGTLAVHATYNHVTTRVLYIILRDRVKKVYPNLEDNTIVWVFTQHLRTYFGFKKQSLTVPVCVGYQYLPTQTVISTLQKVKVRGASKTQSINKKIVDTETDTLLPGFCDHNEFWRGVNSVRRNRCRYTLATYRCNGYGFGPWYYLAFRVIFLTASLLGLSKRNMSQMHTSSHRQILWRYA